ncbi:MAG: sulfite reductase alpha subunit-like flavoprotein/pSer/pThr [Cellvibrionaceae bacterium]|jgi:sulfite reductase alpha subunit-like flavoprotein/pSer/pThr/pTyr-binding forkhead associated (FHA) protein
MSEFETIVGKTRPPANLVGEKGAVAGTTNPISKHQVVIGRDSGSADFVVNDPLASRRHARITWMASVYIIEDLNSSNGTTLNGVRLTKVQQLKSSDKIGIGETTLRFQLVEEGEVPAESLTKLTFVSKLPKPKNIDTVPARMILDMAAKTNQRLGHENLGFLSEESGFLPTTHPPLSLPPGYEAWDEIAKNLPDLWRAIRVRQAIQALPILSAAKEELPDEYLLRASVIISVLAHAYHRISDDPPDQPMPDGIQLPWEQITRRLDRLAPHLSYIDLIIYNWRLVDPNLADDPFRLSNLELLVSTVDNQEEKVLYLMQVEAHYKIGPITGAIVRAQEAVYRDDIEALKKELIFITNGMQEFGNKIFMALNPNPYSDTYVDPVVWAKTVAPFAVPIAEGTVGPSGVGAPLFHMLDVFFGRHDYESHLGAEMLNMRKWYPKHWRDFFEALEEISIAEYVIKRNDPILSGIYKEAAMGYVGDNGFLTVHRLKAYGYLDIAFKVGRSVTIGGFSGLFKDRVWDLAVDELDSSQNERVQASPHASHHAPIKKIEVTNPEGDTSQWVKRVVFDVSQTGMRYLPGDRCAILPENSDDLIEKTLVALNAKGYEKITLTSQWRQAVGLRHGYDNETTITLPLRTLLKFGRIRPVERPVAKALYAISLNEKLRRIVDTRAEDQWELWDMLNLISKAGFDPKRLWKAHPGEREHICRIVPPESFRMYSISSTMDHDSLDGAEELTLTIGRLSYDTSETAVSRSENRYGTTSHFLADTTFATPEDRGHVSLKLVHPPRFNLPEDPRTPIVMFAGGTGVAPFRGFVIERDQQANVGENWLFLGVRTRQEFYYKEQFEPMVANGRLHVRPAFSRDAVDTKFVKDGPDSGHFVFEPGEKRYIGAEMLRDENAEMLWNVLRSKKEGGQGGHLYVCGRTGFATSVMDAIKEILRRYSHGPAEEKEAQANQILYRLVGEDRYKQDIFTTYTGSHIDQKQAYNASEIVLHNNFTDGFWIVISGRVYDMNEFAHIHAGGFKIIHGYAGMDGTQAYEKVQHHVNPEVNSMLGMYELGEVRRLDFGMEWGIVVAPDGLRYMGLADVYRTWVRFLYNVVEMENALYNDYSLKEQTIIADDSPDAYPPIKMQYLLEVHDRFMANFVEGTTGSILENLWAVTSSICSQNQDIRWIKDEVDRINQSQEAETARRISNELQKRINEVVERQPNEDDPTVILVKDYCALLDKEDKRFLHEMKMVSREGVQVFEAFERDSIRLGNNQLLDAIKQFPRVLESYYARVLSGALSILLARPDQ